LRHGGWTWKGGEALKIFCFMCCGLSTTAAIFAGPFETARIQTVGVNFTLLTFFASVATLPALLGLHLFQSTLSWKTLSAAFCGVGFHFALTGLAALSIATFLTIFLDFCKTGFSNKKYCSRGVGSLHFLTGLTKQFFVSVHVQRLSCGALTFVPDFSGSCSHFDFRLSPRLSTITNFGVGSHHLLTGLILQFAFCFASASFIWTNWRWRAASFTLVGPWIPTALSETAIIFTLGWTFGILTLKNAWHNFWLGTKTACPNISGETGFHFYFAQVVNNLQGGLLFSDSHWPDFIHFRQTLELIWRFLYLCFISHSGPFLALLLALRALERPFWWRTFSNSWQLFLPIFQHRHPTTRSLRAQEPYLKNCRSGPKSRYSSAKLRGWRWLLFFLFFTINMQSCWGEGCNPATGVTEVPTDVFDPHRFGTKQRGKQPPVCDRTTSRPETVGKTHTWVEKRSLQRAHRRACLTGSAWYRGRHYNQSDFERMGCPPISLPAAADLTQNQKQDWQQCNRRHMTKGRLHFWQWNSGGLSTATMDEVKAWLVLNCVDVGVILETRLTFDGQWSDQHWNILHSGEGEHRGKGIMIFISKRLCNMAQLRWQFHDSGRLVHVRIQVNPRPLDLVACYQHTYQATRTCQSARDRWWTKLEQVLNGLPNRETLIAPLVRLQVSPAPPNLPGRARNARALCTAITHAF